MIFVYEIISTVVSICTYCKRVPARVVCSGGRCPQCTGIDPTHTCHHTPLDIAAHLHSQSIHVSYCARPGHLIRVIHIQIVRANTAPIERARSFVSFFTPTLIPLIQALQISILRVQRGIRSKILVIAILRFNNRLLISASRFDAGQGRYYRVTVYRGVDLTNEATELRLGIAKKFKHVDHKQTNYPSRCLRLVLVEVATPAAHQSMADHCCTNCDTAASVTPCQPRPASRSISTFVSPKQHILLKHYRLDQQTLVINIQL